MTHSKDQTEKRLTVVSSVFADIFNVLLFPGEEAMQADDLKELSPHSVVDFIGEIFDQEADVVKLRQRQPLMILTLENMTSIAGGLLPLKIASYLGAAYRWQLHELKAAKNQSKDSRTLTRPAPVFALVLYLNAKKPLTDKDQAMTLADCVGLPDKPSLRSCFNDMKVNLVDVAELDRKVIECFKSDFYFLADFLWQKRHNIYEEGKPNLPVGEGKYISPGRQVNIENIKELLNVLLAFKASDEELEQLNQAQGGNMYNALQQRIDEATKDVRKRAEKAEKALKEAKLEAKQANLRAEHEKDRMAKNVFVLLEKIKNAGLDVQKVLADAQDSRQLEQIFSKYGIV